MHFKNREGKPRRENPKKIISVSGGLEFELLQLYFRWVAHRLYGSVAQNRLVLSKDLVLRASLSLNRISINLNIYNF